MAEDIMYGCVDEDEFSLISPRMIDGDEVKTVEEAFQQALDMMRDGTEKVSICKVKYYGEDGNGYWGEIVGAGQISLDAYNADWVKEEEDD